MVWVCLDLVSICADYLGRWACGAGGVWVVVGYDGLLVVWKFLLLWVVVA